MQVILLERVEKLGQMGDVVKVKPGFARNFLLPQKKALRATEANKARFTQQRSQLEATNLQKRQEAEAISGRVDGLKVVLVRQAGETGQLYGSVSPRDIAMAISEGGVTVSRTQVPLDTAIKTIGLFKVAVRLHPEVRVGVTINVARSEDEAERQARGVDVLAERTEAEEAKVAAEELFEEGAGPKAEAGEEAAEAEYASWF